MGSLTGAIAGFAKGGILGGVAGGLVGGALPATGYKTPTASGHGLGYQAAGYTYQQAVALKAAAKRGTATPQIVGNPIALKSSPTAVAPLASSGVGGALSLVGASSLNPLGSIIAGAGAAAQVALGYQASVTNQGISISGGSSLSPTAQVLANGGTKSREGGYVVVRDASGNVVKVYRARHLNPMNVRAARRAIRRIKGARKLLQRIERSLPKARSHRTSSSSRRIRR